MQCLVFGTVSIQKITLQTGGNQDIGFKNPTSPVFRVGWHAPLIRVNFIRSKKLKYIQLKLNILYLKKYLKKITNIMS